LPQRMAGRAAQQTAVSTGPACRATTTVERRRKLLSAQRLSRSTDAPHTGTRTEQAIQRRARIGTACPDRPDQRRRAAGCLADDAPAAKTLRLRKQQNR